MGAARGGGTSTSVAEPHRGRDGSGSLRHSTSCRSARAAARRRAGRSSRPRARGRRAARRPRQPEQLAERPRPRATPRGRRRATTCAASPQNPSPAPRLAVDERRQPMSGRSAASAAHELARVGLTPAGLARARGTGGRGRRASAAAERADAPSAPVGAPAAQRRAAAAIRRGGRPRYGESSDGGQRRGERRAALTVAAAWTAPRGAAARRAARAGPRLRAQLRAQPAAARRDGAAARARRPAAPARAARAAARVGAEHRPPAVALEVEPLVVALVELVVVLDRAPPARCRRPSRPSRRRSDRSRSSPYMKKRASKPPTRVPRLAPHDQRGARGEADLARLVARRPPTRLAEPPGPAEAEAVHDVAARC